jgi:hypothetical protein
VAHVCSARTESILRSDAADGNVQGMVGEQEFRAAGQLLQREVLAALLETRGFAAEVRLGLALLSDGGARVQREEREE